MGFGPFELIATVAGCGQILPRITTASRLRDDVIDHKRHTNQAA